MIGSGNIMKTFIFSCCSNLSCIVNSVTKYLVLNIKTNIENLKSNWLLKLNLENRTNFFIAEKNLTYM